jgi:uncharacterized membrane protein
MKNISSFLVSLDLRVIAWLLLIAVTVIYTLSMGQQAILRYDTFKATAFDLGNMDQSVWNTLHGRPFEVTNQGADWYGPPTRLAMHFEPIIFLVAPLYLIYADPRTLLILQTVALASGALPVFLLTRKYIPTLPLLAPVMVAAYLISPALIGLNIFDFHFVSLATPFLLYAILALTYRRFFWCIIACILAASCKEDIPFAVAMLGVLAIWKYKAPRVGTVLFIGGMLWGFMAFLYIIPHFHPGGNNYLYRYAALGNTPQEIIVSFLLHPDLLFSMFITLDRFYYLANLLRSAGFLALLAPEWLLGALPGLAINLLSVDDKIYSGVFHYNAAIIPFIMLSSIHGLRRAIMVWQQWRGIPGEVAEPSPGKSSVVKKTDKRPSLISGAFAVLTTTWQTMSYSSLAQVVIARPVAALDELRAGRWQRFSECMIPLARQVPLKHLQWVISAWIIAMIALNYMVMTPLFNIFWANREPGSREQQIEQLLAQIPPDAPVSAGVNINPHLTHRRYITVFPQLRYALPSTGTEVIAEYIVVDLNTIFPEDRVSTAETLNDLINSGRYRLLGRAEGVIVLVKNDP